MAGANKFVIFVGRSDVEKIVPRERWSLISITDSNDFLPILKEGWSDIRKFHFIDGDYNEDTLRFVGLNHRYIFSSYFNREEALKMIAGIEQIVTSEPDVIVVHCHAGRSRSAAVAKYISERYGYAPYNSMSVLDVPFGSMPQPDFSVFNRMNTLVYKLLNNPNIYDKVIFEIEGKRDAKQHPRSLYQRVISILKSGL